MHKSIAAVTAALAVASCASSTGILPAGPDTYTLSEMVADVPAACSEA
jgi:hypothetical protein